MRRTPLKSGPRKVQLKIPFAVRAEVKARTHGYCHMCLFEKGGPLAIGLNAYGTRLIVQGCGVARIAHLHHVFSKDRWPELIKEPANLMGCCVTHHFDHEAASHRIPREALLPETLMLAEGNGPMLNELNRKYPEGVTR